MKKQDKYTQILLWAYRKQEKGFTWDELTQEFGLSGLEENWVKKIFKTVDDSDRKFFEHYRNDENVTSNVHYYSLNEKGILAALSYLEWQQTKKSSFRANIFSGVAVLIGVVALGVAAYTGWLTYRSIQIATDPQIEMFLKHDGANDEGSDIFSLGVANIGAVNIASLTVKYFSANVGQDCKDRGEGSFGGGRGGRKWEGFNVGEKIYIPLDHNTWRLGEETPDLSMHVFYVEFQREIDNRIYGQKVEVAIDGHDVYWDDVIPTSNSITNARKCAERILSSHDTPSDGAIIKRPNVD